MENTDVREVGFHPPVLKHDTFYSLGFSLTLTEMMSKRFHRTGVYKASCDRYSGGGALANKSET
jgi:hypothetical protein